MNAPMQGSGVVNALLMSVAQKVQLPPSSYRLAAERYETLGRHLERDGSELKGLVRSVYPQGSISIGAVVSSKFENDEFDVDVMIELGIRPTAPATVLDTLFQTIRGEPGSRYYDMTTRKTRCVTVDYDSMHIDFTPAVLRADPRPRVCNIFHAHEKEPAAKHSSPVANPWGFTQWFGQQMPAARIYTEAVLEKRADPLPDPDELNDKSLPLIALQLIKRWRNKVHDKRAGRRPPSVMLSYFVALHAAQRMTLLEELTAQVRVLLNVFEALDRAGQRIEIMNPTCNDLDRFTDRWPESAADQTVFLHDLRRFAAALHELAKPQTMVRYQELLGQLFGERATKDVMESFGKRWGDSAASGRLHHQVGSGATALRESGIARVGPAASAVVTPSHRHFGGDGS